MLLSTLVAHAESIGVEFGCTMDLHFYSMADQHSNILDAAPPPRSNFLYFHAVFGKIWPINRLTPPRFVVVTPCLRNHESAVVSGC